MKAEDIAKKYVYGKHDALTDNQEIIDMVKDIKDLIKKDRAEQLILSDVGSSLPSFLYKSDGGLYFKHREDADVIEQWNEYLKTR